MDGIHGKWKWLFFKNHVVLRDWAVKYLYYKLSFIAWVLRRWGDKEFRKDDFKEALYFYERCAAVSQDSEDYVQMLRCNVSPGREKMLVGLLYRYWLK